MKQLDEATEVKQLTVKQLAVKPLTVKQLAVKQLAVKQLAVKQLAVKQLAVKQLAVKQLAGSNQGGAALDEKGSESLALKRSRLKPKTTMQLLERIALRSEPDDTGSRRCVWS